MIVSLMFVGLLAQKAVQAGLSVAPYIKTSLSPGSGVVTYYLRESGVVSYLTKLGFETVGFGCMTCIGNSGPLDDAIAETIEKVEISFESYTSRFLFFSFNLCKNMCTLKRVVCQGFASNSQLSGKIII